MSTPSSHPCRLPRTLRLRSVPASFVLLRAVVLLSFVSSRLGCVHSYLKVLILSPHGISRCVCSYAIGFGDRTGPGLSNVPTNNGGYPGVNGGTSTNNPFLGTRFFAMKDLPWNQFNLWYFQWTVRTAT